MSTFTLFKCLWVIAIAAVLTVTLIPLSLPMDLPAQSDKWAHFACYAVLGLLAVLAQPHPRARSYAALAMVAMGVLIECIQGMLPWRSFEWLDMVANSVGVIAGSAVALVYLNTRLRLIGP